MPDRSINLEGLSELGPMIAQVIVEREGDLQRSTRYGNRYGNRQLILIPSHGHACSPTCDSKNRSLFADAAFDSS